jgi:hypothetical protein
MKNIYNPTYELVSYQGIPFMVAIDAISIDRYEPHTGREFEEYQTYVESVLMGGHEMVHLLSEETIDDLLKLVVTSE